MGFLKSIAKKVLPRIFLKNVYRVVKKTKVAVIDPILFGEYETRQVDFLLYRTAFPFRENDVKIDSIQNDVARNYMKDWYDWTQEEFIFEFHKPVTIEPDEGWAIASGRKLLYYSLGISRTWFLPKPALFRYLFRKDVVRVPALISFRDSGEENYFHFFNDVLAKYFLLRSYNISFDSKKVVVSKKLFDKPYFQWYLEQSPDLRKIDWLVQDKEYIETSSAIFCRPLTHRKDILDAVFKPLMIKSVKRRKIFVTRKKNRLRYIVNDAENFFKQRGFDIVDPDVLTIEQQREIFSGASLIAGVHGAALTNVFFAEDCKVLEIFPPPEEGYLPFHYIMVAGMKNFSYNAIIGEGTKLDMTGGFVVDINKIEAALKEMS